MMLTIKAIEDAARWTPAVELQTKRGPRMLRKIKGVPTDTFWKLWRDARAEMVALGVSPKMKDDAWEVCWWLEVPKEVQKARADNVEKSRALDAEVDLPCPDGMAYLPYQKAGIVFALDKEGVFIGDEMGLGKTIQAIGVINANPKIQDVLVVCPAKLKLNWYRELRKWLVRPMSVGIVDPDVFPSTQICIINYDVLHKWGARMEKRYWDLIVADEAHYLKSPKARRTKALIGYNPTRKEREEGMLPTSGVPTRRKIAMSGTPILNRPIELFPIVSWLNKPVWGNWWHFVNRYCGGGRTSYGVESRGATNLDELQTKLRETLLIRRLKKDVLKDLPPKRRQIVILQGDDSYKNVVAEEAAILRDHSDKLARLKANVELAKADDDESKYRRAVEALQQGVKINFEQVSKVRHATALAKLPLVKEWVEEMLESVDKLIILAYHRDVIEALEKSFSGVGALKIYGGMSSIDSQRNVDRFQNDPFYKVIILSIPVAVGMTLTAASNVVAVELDWVPGNMSQAEDRAHRIGQLSSVNVYHLVLEGSMDCNMAETIVEKQDIIDRALDRVKAEQELAEPEVPTVGPVKPISVTREQLAKQAATITPGAMSAIHDGLRRLAGVCNYARSWDGAGFSKIDAAIGHSLAESLWISPKQAAIGQRLIRKYRRQLPEEIVTMAIGEEK